MPVKILSKDKVMEFDIDGTVFQYKQMPGKELAHYERNAAQVIANKTVFNIEGVNLQMLEWGLVGWKNLLDLDGKEVPFSKDIIQYLPGDIRTKLVSMIRANHGLSGEEEKKLES